MRKPRDRRKIHNCLKCKVNFIGKKGQKGISKWCNKCENISLECLNCKKIYSIRRKFYIFRGSKFCSHPCYALWRSKNIKKEKVWNWKGGLNTVIAYRARKRGADGIHFKNEWEELKKKYKYMCLCCKKKEPDIKLEEDHIIPLSKGGMNDILNIQPLCRSCNARKHTKHIDFISQFYEIKQYEF